MPRHIGSECHHVFVEAEMNRGRQQRRLFPLMINQIVSHLGLKNDEDRGETDRQRRQDRDDDLRRESPAGVFRRPH
jgi:hypothetical protein